MPEFDPNKSRLYIVAFAVAISAAFTAAIMVLHVATKDVVDENRQLMHEKALVSVFGFGDVATMKKDEIRGIYREDIQSEPTDDGREFYFAFRPDAESGDSPFAFAVPLHGLGFWAPVEGLLAVDLATSKCIGVVFTAHSETPGLGGRITEPEFRDRWEGLNLTPPAPGRRYVYINSTPPRGGDDPQTGRHVDAISGATGTSTAVQKFTNVCLREYLAKAEALARTIRKGDAHARTD